MSESYPRRTRKQAFFSEDDMGWEWLIKAWTILYHNVVYITGIIIDTQDIVGIIRDEDAIEGVVGKG